MDAPLLSVLQPVTAKKLQLADERQTSITYTTATWHTRTGKGQLNLKTLSTTGVPSASQETTLIIQNVDLSWMRVLASIYDIPTTFFARHATSPAGHDVWDAVLPQTVRQFDNVTGTHDKSRFWHVDGVCSWEAPGTSASIRSDMNLIARPRQWTERGDFNVATTVSAWMCRRQSESTFIIFIDAPVDLISYKVDCWPQHHFPVSRNRGGLLVPVSNQEGRSLRITLEQFFSHNWHYNAVHPEVTATTFWYLVAASTWSTNLRHINKRVKHVAFEEIRHPSIAINNKLHDFRRDLDRLHEGVKLALDWIPASVSEELTASQPKGHISKPKDMFAEILVDARILERFLMDSFSLLLSSIGVLEATVQAKQSLRTQQLTTLAFIYAPLSFVTGIFGMNIAEINGSVAPFWVPLLISAVIMALTLSGAAGWSMLQNYDGCCRRRRSEASQAMARLSRDS